MYELMLDTANLEDLKEGLDSWPVVGVTSNPTILKEEGGIDVYARLREIKALCGKKRSLHVQVVLHRHRRDPGGGAPHPRSAREWTPSSGPGQRRGLPAIKSSPPGGERHRHGDLFDDAGDARRTGGREVHRGLF